MIIRVPALGNPCDLGAATGIVCLRCFLGRGVTPMSRQASSIHLYGRAIWEVALGRHASSHTHEWRGPDVNGGSHSHAPSRKQRKHTMPVAAPRLRWSPAAGPCRSFIFFPILLIGYKIKIR